MQKPFIPLLVSACAALIAVAVLSGSIVAPVDDDERRPGDDLSVSDVPPLDQMIGIEGVSVQPLARGSFPDHVEASVNAHLSGSTAAISAEIADLADVIFAHLTFEPGGFVGWHTHHGPGIVTVVSGALSIVKEADCVAREYAAGQAFVDGGHGNLHVAYNGSGEETTVYVVFLDVPEGQGPTTMVEEPGDCPR